MPFEIVYGVNPFLPIVLLPLNKEDIHVDAKKRLEVFERTCAQVKAKIEKMNAQYKARSNKKRKQHIYKPGDLVWLHLRKERFPSKRKNKLMPRADGPFEVLEAYGDCAYKIDIPSEYGNVSATFNVGDLSPYLDDVNLRANSFEARENDMDQDDVGQEDMDQRANSFEERPITLTLSPIGFGLEERPMEIKTCIAWLGPKEEALGVDDFQVCHAPIQIPRATYTSSNSSRPPPGTARVG